MSDYSKLPSGATINSKPFAAHVSDEKLSQMLELAKLSPIGPAVYENQRTDCRYGMSRKWLTDAKQRWTNGYDWRKCEARINSFPNYTTTLGDDDGNEYDIHFIALFSERKDAIPIAFYHGWPGNILEFLSMLDVVKSKYSPAELPYHIIVPSLPGYAFSSGPSVNRDMCIGDAAILMNKLMLGLGFGSGYIAQGGDIGSYVARQSAERFDACKAFHLNMLHISRPENADKLHVEKSEKEAMPRGDDWQRYGTAYAREHGTKTATIGLVLSSSPIAMLAWIGEKFLDWTDDDPPVNDILDHVSLYWLTDTFPRCIYPYRSNSGPDKHATSTTLPDMSKNQKPMGYSWFPKELIPIPMSWVETTGNLVHYNRHNQGGHFAAMEKPELIWSDIEEFVKVAWKS